MNLLTRMNGLRMFVLPVCLLVLLAMKPNYTSLAVEADYEIEMKKVGAEVSLSCTKGCNWEELSYNISGSVQAINDFGMTNIQSDGSIEDNKKSTFLIMISRQADGFDLQGIKGTAWETLSFTLADGESQRINYYGMIK